MRLKFYSAVLSGLLGFLNPANIFSAEIERSPRALVHLLEYLAQDYSGAVQNGKILSASEYSEQQEFANYARETAHALLGENRSYKSIALNVAELKKLIDSKSSAEKVSALALAIREDVLKVSQLAMAPRHWPSLKNGQRVFESQCGICHGASGHGDGAAGKSLNPAPRDFFDPTAMNVMTGFHIFNVTKLGIPGTGMLAFPQLSDAEAWDVSFYTLALRHQAAGLRSGDFASTIKDISLEKVASRSDDDLKNELKNSPHSGDLDLSQAIAAIRLKDGADLHFNSILIARAKLEAALKLYEKGDQAEARHQALMAYLDGVEPAEPKLRAADASMVTDLEIRMSEIRGAIENKRPLEEVRALVIRVNESLSAAEETLMKQESSPWLSFTLSAGIIFREGFEAILMILAILGVVRAAKARRAALVVHAGWISAILLGVVAWFFSGLLIQMSGAQREITEGATSIFAVCVLLYMGFWLHQRTEIKKWTAFIDGKVKSALEGSKRWTLFILAFVAVFREAFETVLFMRAVYLEGGDAAKTALLSGAVFSIAFTIFLGWLLLRFSLKLPIRQLFGVSSWVMLALAVILVGKGVHSFQEAGLVSATGVRFFSSPFFGVFPTYETLLSQALTIGICAVIWVISSHSQKKSLRDIKAA